MQIQMEVEMHTSGAAQGLPPSMNVRAVTTDIKTYHKGELGLAGRLGSPGGEEQAAGLLLTWRDSKVSSAGY